MSIIKTHLCVMTLKKKSIVFSSLSFFLFSCWVNFYCFSTKIVEMLSKYLEFDGNRKCIFVTSHLHIVLVCHLNYLLKRIRFLYLVSLKRQQNRNSLAKPTKKLSDWLQKRQKNRLANIQTVWIWRRVFFVGNKQNNLLEFCSTIERLLYSHY